MLTFREQLKRGQIEAPKHSLPSSLVANYQKTDEKNVELVCHKNSVNNRWKIPKTLEETKCFPTNATVENRPSNAYNLFCFEHFHNTLWLSNERFFISQSGLSLGLILPTWFLAVVSITQTFSVIYYSQMFFWTSSCWMVSEARG